MEYLRLFMAVPIFTVARIKNIAKNCTNLGRRYFLSRDRTFPIYKYFHKQNFREKCGMSSSSLFSQVFVPLRKQFSREVEKDLRDVTKTDVSDPVRHC
jgi:hypothetical protein